MRLRVACHTPIRKGKHMSTSHWTRRIAATAVAIAATAILGYAPVAGAVALLQSATVSLNSPDLPGFGLSDPLVDNVTVGPNREICIPGDAGCTLLAPGTNIAGDGSAGSTALLPGSYVDLFNNKIVVSLVNGDAGSLHTGFSPGSSFTFTNLVWDVASILSNVTLGLNNITGVSVGAEVLFSDSSVTLLLDTLDIGSIVGLGDVGTVTLNLFTQPVTTPPINGVPLPGTLLLFATALVAGMTRSRHARNA
jgi:hypothetical protein